jgi:hypothetical protein
MSGTSAASVTRREAELSGQTVVVIGGSAGIGLETARLAIGSRGRGRGRGPGLSLIAAAALAVHVMSNTAITGATLDIDGGQQSVEGT